MPDLKDGESVEVQGSARTPYILKNVGGVYSCSCPAWRNQSVAIERRTCKHLRAYRGEQAEQDRLGSLAPAVPKAAKENGDTAPEVAAGPSLGNDLDLTGWWMSEKLDGVRAWWTAGSSFRGSVMSTMLPTGLLPACPPYRLTANCGSTARRSSAP